MFSFIRWLVSRMYLKRVSSRVILFISFLLYVKWQRKSHCVNIKPHRFSSTDLKYSVLIPYVVLQELDNLKRRGGENNFTVKHNATRAIRYIYELIQAENERLRGKHYVN